MNEFEAVDLVTIGNGAAVERFQVELDRVLRNIRDENTDHKKPRQIVLSVTLYPNEMRTGGTIAVAADCKLAPYRPHEVPYFVKRRDDTGQLAVMQTNLEQEDMFAEPRAVRTVEQEEEATQ